MSDQREATKHDLFAVNYGSKPPKLWLRPPWWKPLARRRWQTKQQAEFRQAMDPQRIAVLTERIRIELSDRALLVDLVEALDERIEGLPDHPWIPGGASKRWPEFIELLDRAREALKP